MNIYSRNVVAGVVGGTASVLGGGKFSNGAVMSAFDHLINSEGAGKGFYDRISDGDEISPNAAKRGQVRGDLDAAAPEAKAAAIETCWFMASMIPIGRAFGVVGKAFGAMGRSFGMGVKAAPAVKAAVQVEARAVIQFGRVEKSSLSYIRPHWSCRFRKNRCASCSGNSFAERCRSDGCGKTIYGGCRSGRTTITIYSFQINRRNTKCRKNSSSTVNLLMKKFFYFDVYYATVVMI